MPGEMYYEQCCYRCIVGHRSPDVYRIERMDELRVVGILKKQLIVLKFHTKAGLKSHLNLRLMMINMLYRYASWFPQTQPIEEMVRSTESQSPSNDERTMVNAQSASCIEIKRENVEPFIFVIRTSSRSELCSVRVTKRNVIPKNETVVVTCSVNTGPIESRLPILFEPTWPSGLVIPETLVSLKGDALSRVGIQVENTTEHDITLKNRTVLSKL